MPAQANDEAKQCVYIYERRMGKGGGGRGRRGWQMKKYGSCQRWRDGNRSFLILDRPKMDQRNHQLPILHDSRRGDFLVV